MLRTHKAIATALAALLLPLLVTTTAQAGARRPGLAGSLLINDQDDLWFFPQLTTQYRNLIALTYGVTSDSGNGLLTLGDESFAFGAALHRGDVLLPHVIDELTARGGPSSLFGPAFATTPATVFDILLGMDVGGGDLGFRLGFGSGGDYMTAANMDTGANDTFIVGTVGYGGGTRGQDTRVDISGSVLFDFASAEAANMATQSGLGLGASVLVRAYVPLDGTLDLGLLANAGLLSLGVTQEMPPMASDSSLNIGVGGGIGPAFRLGAASVAGYGIVNVSLVSADPNSELANDETFGHTIVIPGMHIAVEVPISSWLLARSGAEYRFNVAGTADAADNGDSSRTGTFGWNAGLGVVIDDFRFDGSLQHGFVTGGPDFIGGGGPGGAGNGFLAIASLSYNFDAARKATPAPAPAAPLPAGPTPPVAPAEPEPPPPAPEAAPAPATPQPSGWIGNSASGTTSATTAPAAGPAPAPPPAAPAPAPAPAP